MRGTEDWIRLVVDDFRAAGVDGGWDAALYRLAECTGASSSQLIGVSATGSVPFNRIINVPEEALSEWRLMDGADPRRNARVRAGLTAPELQVASDDEFASSADLRGEVYDLFRRNDIEYSFQTTLHRERNLVAGLSVMRGARLGPMDPMAKQVFAAIAPHAQAAVRLHLGLESEGAALVAGAFASMSMAVFVCNPAGNVCALSPAAEALVSEQRHLGLVEGQLRALHPQDRQQLSHSIAAAGIGAAGEELYLRAPVDGSLLKVQVAPMAQRDYGFRFRATTLVVARLAWNNAQRLPRLQAQFGLTMAEAQVADALSRGRALAELAAERRVSIATLRSQLKAVFSKVGVRRQAELAAKLAEL